jgi:tetratricopeptide (TPR) repeat protein
MLLRRLGRPDEAYAPARRAFETQPSWLTATEWATVERRRGRTEEAARLYREAARLDPADATALIDLGDMMLEARRPALAAAAYREALERAPDDGWARASQLFALWRAGDPNAKSALTTMASGHDDAASRARALLSIA